MKKRYFVLACLAAMSVSVKSFAQTDNKAANTSQAPKKDKNDPASRAEQFVSALSLTDTAKANRVKAVIAAHITAVHDWHNNHSYTLVPEGIDPINGKVFSTIQRQFIIDSTIPKTVHEELMTGLRKDLTEEQVDVILDKYTIGKFQFTLNGYKSIVPDMTQADLDFITKELGEAREEAVDYKDIKNEMSTVFKIHKTHIEDYFNGSGRNWKTMYKTYVDKVLAAKKAGDKSTPAKN